MVNVRRNSLVELLMEEADCLQENNCNNDVHLLGQVRIAIGLKNSYEQAGLGQIRWCTYEFQDKSIPRCY